jgi:hypothetical protein
VTSATAERAIAMTLEVEALVERSVVDPRERGRAIGQLVVLREHLVEVLVANEVRQ